MRRFHLALFVFAFAQACRPPASDDGDSEALEIEAAQSDLSPPLRDMAPRHALAAEAEERDRDIVQKPPFRGGEDPLVQREIAVGAPPALVQNFEGIGQGFVGPGGTFTDTLAPPDTNGDVGPNHYFQIANNSLVIFDKKGKALYGPAAVTTIFTGFGGACETGGIGDPIVLYDQLADRWVVTEIAEDSTGKFSECIALSNTGDPTGQYHRYAFAFTSLNDYPKMGVWPDGYYYTVNLDGAAPEVCALDRATALAGGTPKQQCFKFGSKFSGTVLPADLDGKTAPPTGAPNYLVGLGTNQLSVFNLHLDWKTKSKSKLSAGQKVTVASFNSANDVTQPRGDTLEALSDRLMYRLAYRNFGDHEALVVNHSVDVSGHAGVRWYELRSPAKPTLFQQGTYAPDTQSRWMGSVAMDKRGNIAAGFSIGSATTLAGIGYSGRLATDPPGTFGQGEGLIVAGTGAESGISRWGDYSAMAIDPVDDCTFWYTTEYIQADGGKVWHTRVAAFALPGCK
jgi:hypothetical protein